MLDDCVVSHHVVNKMRGALHKETIYSKDYSNGDSIRHERIALDKLDAKDIKQIVDQAVKNIILNKLGVENEDQVTNAMLKIFGDKANYPMMLDRNGNAVNVIKKVRVARTLQTRTIGKGDGRREVANGSNYILAIFAKLNDSGEEIGWVGEVVTLLDAVQRKQRKQPLFDKNRPGMKFKFSLQKGDIVQITKDGEDKLCVIRGISLPQFSCCPVNDARKQDELKKAKCWFTPTVTAAFNWKMKKYNMNIFGELQRAND